MHDEPQPDSCLQRESCIFDFIISLSGNDIMNQIMIADSWSPLIERIAFLESYIVDGQRYKFFFGHFVGIFIILIHKKDYLPAVR